VFRITICYRFLEVIPIYRPSLAKNSSTFVFYVPASNPSYPTKAVDSKSCWK